MSLGLLNQLVTALNLILSFQYVHCFVFIVMYMQRQSAARRCGFYRKRVCSRRVLVGGFVDHRRTHRIEMRTLFFLNDRYAPRWCFQSPTSLLFTR
jgi:hypothetical protein